MLGIYLQNVRDKAPLVHNITNYVTVNDVANVLLACGGSPIMSDEPQDVEDITSICGGLNINIGTLNVRSIEGMLKAGKRSNQMGHPVLLDPVGAGASDLNLQAALTQGFFCHHQQGVQGLLGVGVVAAVISEENFAVFIQNNQLDGGGANVNAGTIGFHMVCLLYVAFSLSRGV